MLPERRTVSALLAYLAQVMPQQEAVVLPPRRPPYAALYAQATVDRKFNGIFAPVSMGAHSRSPPTWTQHVNLCTAACACRYARWLCRVARAMADGVRDISAARTSPPRLRVTSSA
jgi:hypothetical protein